MRFLLHYTIRLVGRLLACFSVLVLISGQSAAGQQPLTWADLKSKFRQTNPVLRADSLSVDELQAQEITAYLRPNPTYTVAADGTQLARHYGQWLPFAGTQVQNTFNYLHERDHKRELRLKSAQEGTQIGRSQHEDLQRNLLFTLRTNYVQTLQAKRMVDLARADLVYWDQIIDISRNRFRTGDLAQIDLDRIELLRVQYESELQNAIVNLRTAKIQLLLLLDDRTPVDAFDIAGLFDAKEILKPLDDFHEIALDARPDLRASFETVTQSRTNHQLAIANGSTDPTFSIWETHNASFNNPTGSEYLGFSIGVPLRIFDRNQGEKKRTLIDIDRSQVSFEANRAQVFSDVDTAYELVCSNLVLVKPYKDKYLAQASRVRDTVTYAYFRGGASLMDFLNAQSDYRTVQMAYVQLVGAYMTAAGQLSLAVGREVMF